MEGKRFSGFPFPLVMFVAENVVSGLWDCRCPDGSQASTCTSTDWCGGGEQEEEVKFTNSRFIV